MTLKEFKAEVLKALHNQREVFATMDELAGESTKLVLAQVLEVVADAIEDVEDLDDGPPLQDETELAHNELDRHDVPRMSEAPAESSLPHQANTLPLWFRIKSLAERETVALDRGTVEMPDAHLRKFQKLFASVEDVAALYCVTCRANGRLSNLEFQQDGSTVCLRCEANT